MTQIEQTTRLLRNAAAGASGAADELLPLVFEELRKLAGGYMRRERRAMATSKAESEPPKSVMTTPSPSKLGPFERPLVAPAIARPADRLMTHLYGELHAMAVAAMGHERSDHTLQPTALVHEAYLRLVDVDRNT